MEYGILPLPKRQFGDAVTDIVPVRGLKQGGPYFIPSEIERDKVYIVPIVMKAPEFDLDSNHALEIVNGIRKVLKDYFRVRSEIITIDGEPWTLQVSDYSVDSARKFYDELSGVKHELEVHGYRDRFKNIIVLLFTRSTAPQIKVTPYYVTKMIFGYEPVSQVITERALANPQMSYTNIALGIFTKLGGVPWRLKESIPSTDLIIGVGRTIIRYPSPSGRGETSESWMGSVAIMRSDGVFCEARAAVLRDKNELANWIAENVNVVINNFVLKHALEEINVSVHYSGKRVSKEELERIEDVIDKIKRNVRVNVKIVHITDDIPHRLLCENFNMYPLSGFYWVSSEREAYLTPLGASLVGSKVYYSFVGIPHTLKVSLVKSIGSFKPKEALIDALHEIYSLTFMHLAGLNININEPVSTKYSRELTYLVQSLEVTSKIIAKPFNARSVYDRLWFL